MNWRVVIRMPRLDIWFTFKSLTDGGCHLLYLYSLMGDRIAYGCLFFPGTGCPVPDITNIYVIWNAWATVSTTVHPPRMFPPTDFLFEKRIGLVSMGLLYIILTYYTQVNQQECFGLSNWFSLRCLGPWMNHLPPVWGSNFRSMLQNESCCVSFTYRGVIFYWCLVFIVVWTYCPNVTSIISLIWLHSEIAFLF